MEQHDPTDLTKAIDNATTEDDLTLEFERIADVIKQDEDCPPDISAVISGDMIIRLIIVLSLHTYDLSPDFHPLSQYLEDDTPKELPLEKVQAANQITDMIILEPHDPVNKFSRNQGVGFMGRDWVPKPILSSVDVYSILSDGYNKIDLPNCTYLLSWFGEHTELLNVVSVEENNVDILCNNRLFSKIRQLFEQQNTSSD